MSTTVKKWSEMNFNQKRHALYGFLKARTPAFWKVCGKSVQKSFENCTITEDNIETVRDDICNMYRLCLKNANVLDKDIKIDYMERRLLK